MKLKNYFAPLFAVLLVLPQVASANAGWATLIIAISPSYLWYLSIASIFVEALIFMKGLTIGFQKALPLSLFANLISFLMGLLIGVLGVLALFQGLGYLNVFPLWITDVINHPVLAISFMFVLTVFSEAIFITFVGRLNFRRVLLVVTIGNLVTYIPLILFMMYGWMLPFGYDLY